MAVHSVLPFQLRPCKSGSRVVSNKVIHVLFRDAIDVDFVPVAVYSITNILGIVTEPTSKISSAYAWKPRRHIQYPRLQLCPQELGFCEGRYARNNCDGRAVQSTWPFFTCRQNFDLWKTLSLLVTQRHINIRTSIGGISLVYVACSLWQTV